jgi:phosphonate transport system permease protein
MSAPGAETAALKPPTRPLSARLFDLAVWGGLIALLAVSFAPVQVTRASLLFTRTDNMQSFVQEFLRPDFSQWRTYVVMMWLTIQMALWGTFLAVVVAVPLGLLASHNLTPYWIQLPVRRLLDLLRAVPDLVVGTIFLVAVGPGPFTGVLALAVNTGGVLAKLFSEAVEQIERGPVEGVRATGAAPLQEVVWGVMPQVAPLWTSYGLYRFEAAARSATVLGIIGAGGIGQTLIDSINGFDYSQTGAIVLVVVLAVTGIDVLSQIIRTRLT